MIGDEWQSEPKLYGISIISADQMVDPHARIVSIDGKPVEAKSGADHEGAMVAFFLSSAEQKKLALDCEGAEPAEDLHITLAYFDAKAADMDAEHWDKVARVVAEVAREWAPLEGTLGGWGRFAVDEGDEPFILSVDVVGLGNLQQRLDEALEAADAPLNRTHGFNPHVTLAYLPEAAEEPDVHAKLPFDFKLDSLSLTVGGKREDFKLTGESRVARAFPATVRHVNDRSRDTNMSRPLVSVVQRVVRREAIQPAEDPITVTDEPAKGWRGAKWLRRMLGYPTKNSKGETLEEHRKSTIKAQRDFHNDWIRNWGDSQNGTTPVRITEKRAEVNPDEIWPGAAEQAMRALGESGGFTLAQSGESVGVGYVASYDGYEEKIRPEEMGVEAVERKIDQARNLAEPGVMIGGWFNSSDGLVYIDLSRTFESLVEAVKFAQTNRQKAIWDGYNQTELVWSDTHQGYVPGSGSDMRPTGSAVTLKGEFFRNTLRNIIQIPGLYDAPEATQEPQEAAPAGAEIIPFPMPPAMQQPSERAAAAPYDWEQDDAL